MEYVLILIAAILADNFVFTKFLESNNPLFHLINPLLPLQEEGW